jgi:cytoskeletal protein CcmA (bactofilin family)
MGTQPVRTTSFSSEGGSASLGRAVSVKGQIVGREDLTIDGEIEGTIQLQEHRLTVGPSAKIRAGIHAREVIILGTVHGKIESTEKIEIRSNATLIGDIRTARVVIEDGAYFKGAVDITRNEKAPPAQQK